MAAQGTIYVGRMVHCPALDKLEIIEHGAIGVDRVGKIVFVDRDTPPTDEDVLGKYGWAAAVVRAGDAQFFFPGFVDTHIHASQYPNAGIFGKSTLLDWLNTYTFPLEASLADLDKARTVYSRCVARTLAHGTTTAAYYATIDAGSTNLLADECHAAGQRAFVGRCAMDALSPDYYKDASPEASIAATRETIAHLDGLDPNRLLLSPIITPRFAPSCSPDLLSQLGGLAEETQLPVQTHLSETEAECDLVRELFPSAPSYAAVYDEAGLLGARTVLAHCIHLSPPERTLIASRGAKISHCPASNMALGSGNAPVRTLLDAGIGVGLGTDVSGGYSPSVLEAARLAALVSRSVARTSGDDGAKLGAEEVLYLATRGGADVLGLKEKVGGFEAGLEWDAQLVQPGKSGLDIFGWETWPERVCKWTFGGDDRDTRRVWVKGREVCSKET
ncbi:MAG: hypothetical protein M1832_004672 [Thelocarpon impressellum]|nr:MAG: hypothetical protein M1832_004672 [Thelocarpon impressellum]